MAQTTSIPNWSELTNKWKSIQNELRAKIKVAPLNPLPRFVAGADVAFSPDKKTVLAAAVIYDRIDKQIIEVAHARRPIEYLYIPGFLSFREGPTLLDAIGKLQHEWGVICCDGQGIAHPRRCGLATHISVMLDRPGIGVAKSRLFGTYQEPLQESGSTSPLMDGEEQIGLVLRTRPGVRPLFISIGHRVDLMTSLELVMSCTSRYRIPEPTRQADIEVAKMKHGNELQNDQPRSDQLQLFPTSPPST
jgi:deoxyribonuclease V